MKFSEIELGKIYEFQSDTTQLPPSGIEEIGKYLKSRYKFTWYGNAVGLGSLTFEKNSTDPSFRGNITTQYSKFMAERYQIKISNEEKSEIGNIAKRYFLELEKYKFDFTDKINWKAGDFGDGGSCYWGGRSAARDALYENNAWAIRFYNPETGKGIGRCWLTRIDDENGIIWNGYGPSSWGDQLIQIRNVITKFMNLDSKRIELENNGSESGTVYINSGRGFVIGPDVEIFEDYYDLNYAVSECFCAECGDTIPEDDVYTHGDRTYCEDCYYERFCTCGECGNLVDYDEVYEMVSGSYSCPDCYQKHGTTCDRCDNYVYQEDTYSVKTENSDSEESWCNWCTNRHTKFCEKCSEAYAELEEDICCECKKEAVEMSGDQV